jgi:hypothetical protein
MRHANTRSVRSVRIFHDYAGRVEKMRSITDDLRMGEPDKISLVLQVHRLLSPQAERLRDCESKLSVKKRSDDIFATYLLYLLCTRCIRTFAT